MRCSFRWKKEVEARHSSMISLCVVISNRPCTGYLGHPLKNMPFEKDIIHLPHGFPERVQQGSVCFSRRIEAVSLKRREELPCIFLHRVPLDKDRDGWERRNCHFFERIL